VNAFPSEVYRFPSLPEIVAELAAAGFVVEGGGLPDGKRPVLLLAAKAARVPTE
jgi:hypothetical protein